MLSICIPTYNRYFTLKPLVLDLIKFIEEYSNYKDIEILISDNGSKDGSFEFLSEISEEYSFIHVNFNYENTGYGNNLNKVVSMASKEYVWLLGSDEVVIFKELESIISNLVKKEIDVIVSSCFNSRGKPRNFFSTSGDKTFKINNVNDFCDYLNYCNEFSSAFAFMSTLIISRKYWYSIEMNEYELNHAYTHMLRLTKAISFHSTTIIISDKKIVKSGTESNEWNSSHSLHFTLDINTTVEIIKKYFISNKLLIVAYRELILRHRNILVLRSQTSDELWKLNYIALSFLNIKFNNKKFYDPFISFVYNRIKLSALFIIKLLRNNKSC